MALQNSSIDSMDTFLSKKYCIPNYQREYSWETTELTDFWDDLEYTVNDNDGMKHFFGQVVVHYDETDGKRYIIDGQQRTITSMIFLRVLQCFYEDIYNASKIKGADYKRTDIEIKYIGREDEYHLTLGELDKDYFCNNIQLGIPNETKKEKKKSHERIRQAYFFFKNKITDVLSNYTDSDDKLDNLNNYYYAFIDRFNVLYMEATKLEEAFIIFETLNARGKDLETSDLLKNYIFSQSKDVKLAQKQWSSMINKLDKVDSTKYIRHFWNSSNKFIREKELYKQINSTISSPRECKELLNKLEKISQCYHDIVCPDDNIEFQDEKLVQSLVAIKTLKASSFYPVILAMKLSEKQFSEFEIRKVIETIEIYVFRNFTICGLVANRAEIFFANLAKGIYDGIYTSVDEICKEIRKGMESDDSFISSFELWTGTKSNKEIIRYILRKIHQHIDTDNELNLNTSEVHIEHIMPEDASQWIVDNDIHETYLWRLGNLALISGKKNISMSNKPFNQKVSVYNASKIEPNKDVAAYLTWDEMSIEKRQKQLAQYALKIWKK